MTGPIAATSNLQRSARTPQGWAPGPPRALLGERTIHVWRADLRLPGDQLEVLLCASERARAERMIRAAQRARWIRSRGLLRALLGRYLDADPRALEFTVGPDGKPALAGEGPPAISFNLSHSAHRALYAFAPEGQLGIDVQLRRGTGRAASLRLAERLFGAADAVRLRALGPAQREREFLRLWTRREAELKCRGAGLLGRGARRGDQLWIAELELGRGAAGAIASAPAPRELRCWDWAQ